MEIQRAGAHSDDLFALMLHIFITLLKKKTMFISCSNSMKEYELAYINGDFFS